MKMERFLINHEFHYNHLKILKLNCAASGEFPSKLVIKALVLHFLYAFCQWKDGLMLIFFAIDATWSENRNPQKNSPWNRKHIGDHRMQQPNSVFRGGNWILLVLEPPQLSGVMYPCSCCSVIFLQKSAMFCERHWNHASSVTVENAVSFLLPRSLPR